MKTKKYKQYFLVIVPHRDTRLEMRKWSDCLFKRGFYGAYLFSWVIPAALLSAPLDNDELKHCARVIRDATLNNDGKIYTTDCSTLKIFNELNGGNENTLLFGPKTELNIPQEAFTESASLKIIKTINPLVIGCGLLFENEKIPTVPAPKLSFRAAALAVMSFRFIKVSTQPESAIACKWKISKLHWLPSYKKRQ